MNVNECSGICIIITSLILLSLNFFSKLHNTLLIDRFFSYFSALLLLTQLEFGGKKIKTLLL